MRETNAGLVVAEQSADEASIGRALKQIDQRLVLQKHPADVPGAFVYKVFCVWSESHPAAYWFTWADDRGRPLPLSSGLIEEAKRWRPDARNRRGPDANERNRRLVERTDKDRRDQLAAIGEDHAAKIERDRVTVSLGANTSLRYWQRNLRPPQSGRPT